MLQIPFVIRHQALYPLVVFTSTMLGTFPASVKQMAKQNSSSTESCAMSCALAWLVCTKSNFSCAGHLLRVPATILTNEAEALRSFEKLVNLLVKYLQNSADTFWLLNPLKPLKPRMGP